MMEPPLTSKVLRAPNLKRGQENIRIQNRVSDDNDILISHTFYTLWKLIFTYIFKYIQDNMNKENCCDFIA